MVYFVLQTEVFLKGNLISFAPNEEHVMEEWEHQAIHNATADEALDFIFKVIKDPEFEHSIR